MFHNVFEQILTPSVTIILSVNCYLRDDNVSSQKGHHLMTGQVTLALLITLHKSRHLTKAKEIMFSVMCEHTSVSKRYRDD